LKIKDFIQMSENVYQKLKKIKELKLFIEDFYTAMLY